MYGKPLENYLACDLNDLRGTRLTNLFAPYVLVFLGTIKLNACIELTADSMRVVKRWVNGWATSPRYLEPVK